MLVRTEYLLFLELLGPGDGAKKKKKPEGAFAQKDNVAEKKRQPGGG
jgi:hypothetical protein